MSNISAVALRRPGPAVRKWLPGAVSTAAALGVSLYMALRSYQVDIDVYRMGGRHVFVADLYTVKFGGLPFTYTPFAALVFALPALNLAISSLQRVWAVVNIGLLAVLVNMSIRFVLPDLDRRKALRWSLVLMLPALLLDPVFVNVGLGQINLALCALVMWDLLGERRIGSRTAPLGVATGIAAAIKLTPLIFVPYMLMTRRARGAANALVTFVLCGAVSFFVSPHDSVVYWTKDFFDSKRAGALLYTSDQNLSSVVQRFHHGPVSLTALLPALVVICAGGLVLAAWAHRRSSPFLGVLVCATTGLVVSPITWVHHLVWIVPALVWIAAASDGPKWGRVIAVATAVLFFSAPIWWVPTSWRVADPRPPELDQNAWQLVAGNSFFFAMIAFLVGVAVMLGLRARSARHLVEGQDRAPVARGPDAREALLEEGVVELGPSVAVRKVEEDLRAHH